MKMLAAAVALATLITAPALAQTRRQVVDSDYGYRYDRGPYGSGYSAYGYAPSRSGYYAYGSASGYAPNRGYYAYGYAPGLAYGSSLPWRPSPYNVFDTSGNYIGSDPDPNVRDQLARDPSQGGD